jgi:hypothetical protein
MRADLQNWDVLNSSALSLTSLQQNTTSALAIDAFVKQNRSPQDTVTGLVA